MTFFLILSLLSLLTLLSFPSLLSDNPPSDYIPSYPDCLHGPLSSYPICSTSFTPLERATNLVSLLTLSEKINLLGDTAYNISRLGLPTLEWWNEALHGVAISPGIKFYNFSDSDVNHLTNATSFPMPIAVSSSFSVSLFSTIGTVISTELRAFNNYNQSALTIYTPNINFARAPMWGRLQEVPSEDLYLSSEYLLSIVNSLHGLPDEDPRYLKTVPTCKHFSAYDMEHYDGVDRSKFNAVVADLDLVESYFPLFEHCIKEGQINSIMCSYNEVNGIPSCANKEFNENLIKSQWGFDGYIVSDCAAINEIYDTHNYTTTWNSTMGVAIQGGVDMECGTSMQQHMLSAIENGDVTEEEITERVIKSYTILVRSGYFDMSDGNNEDKYYRDMSNHDVSNLSHQQSALRAAEESIILLKNNHSTLPLPSTLMESGNKPLSIAFIGPNANSDIMQLGNYYGVPPYIYTPYTGFLYYIENMLSSPSPYSSSSIFYSLGCNITSNDTSHFTPALLLANSVDIVVFVMGLDQSVESEGLDRETLEIPEIQRDFVDFMIGKMDNIEGKTIILITISGGMMDITTWRDNPLLPSILHVGYPGQAGGIALSKVLLGIISPAGRLPLTVYPARYLPLNSPFIMEMRGESALGTQGRTYKFYEGESVYAFGYGLGYSEWSYKVWSEAGDREKDWSLMGNEGEMVRTGLGGQKGYEEWKLYLEYLSFPSQNTLSRLSQKEANQRILSFLENTLGNQKHRLNHQDKDNYRDNDIDMMSRGRNHMKELSEKVRQIPMKKRKIFELNSPQWISNAQQTAMSAYIENHNHPIMIDLDAIPPPSSSSSSLLTPLNRYTYAFGFHVNVTNTGKFTSDHSVLLFMSHETGYNVSREEDSAHTYHYHANNNNNDMVSINITLPSPPLKQLIGFDRLSSVSPGETQTIFFAVSIGDLMRVTRRGEKVVKEGKFEIMVGMEREGGLRLKGEIRGKMRWVD